MDLLNSLYELQKQGISFSSKKRFVQKIVNELKTITSFLGNDKRIQVSTRIYCLEHNITERPRCNHPNCNNYTKFYNIKEGFANWCSNKCSKSFEGQQIIREKIKSTNIQKYGATCALHDSEGQYQKEIQERRLEKYGVRFSLQRPDVIQKIKDTVMKNHGVQHPWLSPTIRQNIINTNLRKYGYNYTVEVPQFKILKEKTNIQRYGFKYPTQNSNIKLKTKQTIQDRYDRSYINQQHITKDVLEKLNDASWLVDQHINQKKTLMEIGESLGVCAKTMTNYFKKYNINVSRYNQSSGERSICEFLDSKNIEYVVNDNNIIYPKELDIVIPKYKIAIEYCGLYWHSEQLGRTKYYHTHKLNQCKLQGYRLLTIFEDEWKEKHNIVKNTIAHLCEKNEQITTYARNTTIKKIDKKIRKDFLNQNHIQGDVGSTFQYGLYDKSNNLVACIACTVTKTCVYIVRYATSCCVPGGFSKLLKSIIRLEQINLPIVTFADMRISNGDLYHKTGFVIDKILEPDYCYSKNGLSRIHKFNFRHKHLHKHLKYYDPSISEMQNCDNNGILRIWDCGKIRFIYTNHL